MSHWPIKRVYTQLTDAYIMKFSIIFNLMLLNHIKRQSYKDIRIILKRIGFKKCTVDTYCDFIISHCIEVFEHNKTIRS